MSSEVSGDYQHPAIGTMRTCDACSENDTPIAKVESDTEAYICERCVAFHEEAVNAGAVALAAELGHTLAAIGLDAQGDTVAQAAPNTLRMARIVIDAYEAAYFGSSATPPEVGE